MLSSLSWILTIITCLTLVMSSVSQTYRAQVAGFFSLQSSLDVAGLKSASQQAAAVLAAEAVDDADGYPLPPQPQADATAPAGGGLVPTGSKAPRMAGNKFLGYCAWDNGANTSHAGYIPGINSPASVVLAVISSGKDGAFQTTCAQAGQGVTVGDDVVVRYFTTQLKQPSALPS